MRFKNFLRYESFIIVGLAMLILSLLKLSGVYDFSSDWFWFIAALGLIIEGSISLIKQKIFDKKYKIVLRETAKKR